MSQYAQTPTPYGHMGYVGSLQLANLPGINTAITVRCTSCDIKASQDITFPDVIDGRIDKTLYQVAPLIVGGTAAFPLTHEQIPFSGCPSGSSVQITNPTMASTMWQIAAQRDAIGRLYNTFTSNIQYTDNTGFTYNGCVVNSLTFTINQSEAVQVSMEVWGGIVSAGTQARVAIAPGSAAPPVFLSPARVVTWNDAQVVIFNQDNGNNTLSGNEIKEFTCKIENGLERIYTLNGTLAAQDITAKKRNIEGTLKFLGYSGILDGLAYTNSSRYTAKSAISFGYCLSDNTAVSGNGSYHVSPYWATGLYGVVFKIADMALSTGVFETNMTYHAMGDCNNDYLATRLGDNTATSNLPTIGNYGSSTTLGYPDFSGVTLNTLM